MPLTLGHWKMDNFYVRPKFQMMPNHYHDCYFFFYSTCTKGKRCEYRHELKALGHEKMCEQFISGKCYNIQCKNRHMFIKKDRTSIQCYFESQPNGCTKPHCVFKHNGDANTSDESGIQDGSLNDTNN